MRTDNFKPAAIDYSQPGTLTQAEDGAGEVSLVVASTAVPPSPNHDYQAADVR